MVSDKSLRPWAQKGTKLYLVADSEGKHTRMSSMIVSWLSMA